MLSCCLSALCHLVDTQTLSPCVNTEQRRRFRSVSLLYSRAVTRLHSGVTAIDTEQIWPHNRSCRCLTTHLNLRRHCLATCTYSVVCGPDMHFCFVVSDGHCQIFNNTLKQKEILNQYRFHTKVARCWLICWLLYLQSHYF